MANIMRIGGGGGGEKPQLTVTAPTGSTVTCTKGTKTVTTQEVSGTWLFKLPEFGMWTVTATKAGASASSTVDVVQGYTRLLSYTSASLTPRSGITYTNGIAGLTAEQMNLYGGAISSNADITNTTSVVYIDDGTLHYKVSVGDSINLTVSGASYEFVVLGFNHDELTSPTAYGAATATGKAGFTLQMRNCLATTYGMNPSGTNANGWNGCAFRATLQSTIKNSMNDAWQSVIKTVHKLTSAGSQSVIINTSNDTLFLLSEVEVFNSLTYSASGEGSQYAWYRAGNTKAKTRSGAAANWWERSPWASKTTAFCRTNGSTAYAESAYISNCIAFAFCI